MPVRKLTLGEWFLYHQLQHIERHHFHLPVWVQADLSELQAAWSQSGQTLPLTFILIKALALTLKHEPAVNRQFVPSFWGPRLLEGRSCAINVPVMLNFDGEDYLSVTTVQAADGKSIDEIKAEIKAFFQTPKHKLPVGKYIIGKPNTWFNRTRLRLIHALVNGLPSLPDRLGVGTASVSSLLNLDHTGTDVCIAGRGPGALSLTASHFDAKTGQLRLALAWDHHTGPGLVGTQAAITLCRILQNEVEAGALFP